MGRKSTQSYPSAQVKIYNERVRKLEKVYLTPSGSSYAHSGKSYFYNQAVDWAFNNPNGNGKFFNAKMIDGKTHIRLITKSQYEKLTTTEKVEFNRMVMGGLKSKTSTKTGVLRAQSKGVDTFIENHPEQFKSLNKINPKMSKEERKILTEENERIKQDNKAKAEEMLTNIKEFFGTYKDHFQYNKDTWALLATHYDLEKFFTDNVNKYGFDYAANIFMKAWYFAENDQWEQIPKKYRTSN